MGCSVCSGCTGPIGALGRVIGVYGPYLQQSTVLVPHQSLFSCRCGIYLTAAVADPDWIKNRFPCVSYFFRLLVNFCQFSLPLSPSNFQTKIFLIFYLGLLRSLAFGVTPQTS
jgi:hypothetical protein